ncbi:hypothetical protein H8D36_05760 [archaeon]|nr:hypothetical protein [archaeon]MBL7057053.1 hypothetical protein [Candidatus Woesearchaeota archaeon]
MIKFGEAIANLGFDIDKFELEHSLSGSNNNVIGLKYDRKITWAISISFPKIAMTNEKRGKYVRLQKICAYLTDEFKEGIAIDENSKFMFDGNCFLCDSESTKAFLVNLAEQQSFELGKEFLDYDSEFFVKKGAPASETLEYDIDFKTIMLQGLSILHKETGVVELIDKALAVEIILCAISDLKEAKLSEHTNKVAKKLGIKFNPEQDVLIQPFIELEALIRSTDVLDHIVKSYIAKHKLDAHIHKCFIHGDAHGGNFIVVQTKDGKEVHPIDVEDAKGIKNKEHYLFDLVKFIVSAYNLSRIFKKPLEVDDLVDIYYSFFQNFY